MVQQWHLEHQAHQAQAHGRNCQYQLYQLTMRGWNHIRTWHQLGMTLHIGPTCTQDWSIFIGRMERPLQAEVINIIGRFVGLSRADTWWALPLGGITCQFCSLANGGYSDTWTMMGWLIAFADEGNEMMIGHNETVFIETDMF